MARQLAGASQTMASHLPRPSQRPPRRTNTQSLESRSPSITPLEPEEDESIARRYASRTPSSDSPVGANVFDVPSSDDELAALPPKPSSRKPAKQAKATNIRKTLPASTENNERRKKAKLSSARQASQEPPPVKPTKQPVLTATNQASKQLSKALPTGQSSRMVAQPKPSAAQKQLERPRTPQKRAPSPKPITPPTPTTGPRNVDAMDVDRPAAYISPKGLRLWKDLLEPLDGSEIDSTFLEFDAPPNGKGTSPSGNLIQGKIVSKTAGISKTNQKTPEILPRQRLIDSLVEQGIQNDEATDDMASSDDSEISSSLPTTPVPTHMADPSRDQHLVAEASGPAALTSSQGSQSIGPKFTYSRQRSMLSEKDIMKDLAFDIPLPPSQTPKNGKTRRGGPSTLSPIKGFPEDEDDIEGTPGIRSVHELRQAGANNRFLDEVEDLLDRIGTPSSPPSSMRRAGLLDLANKMKDKEFERKFRAHGVEQRLFLHLDQETDFIAGFVMVSILITLLVDATMPHVAAQLRRHGIAGLLIRLLDNKTGIVPLSNERKTNMSKITRSSISQVQDFLLKLPVWEELQPQTITPRTAALKCLELMIRQTREAGDAGNIISKELTTALFSILKSAGEDSSWELPSGQQAIDFCLALSALESHSITARSTYDQSIWISEYLPIIADSLQVGLSRPVEAFGLLQVLVLRLTLNVTNNNPQASDVFAREQLMAAMGQAVVTKFTMVSHFLTEEEFSLTMDHLILVLGVMINFAEWSSLSRSSLQALEGKPVDPLGGMIQLFLDNQSRTSEVGSPSHPVRSKLISLGRIR